MRKVLQYDLMVYHVASPDISLVSAENETRACSPDSQATEMIPSSIPSSPTIATASEMTHSAKSTERKFRAGAGEGVLFHYIYIHIETPDCIIFWFFRDSGESRTDSVFYPRSPTPDVESSVSSSAALYLLCDVCLDISNAWFAHIGLGF